MLTLSFSSDVEPASLARVLADSTCTLDWLKPSDIPAMLDLFRRGLTPAELSRSIYSARGADKFLLALVQDPGQQHHEQLWGVKDQACRLLGAAHTRNLVETSHLNLITVEPDFQCQGLASWMLAHWERLARTQGASCQTLDVAESNPRARRLYARHGFAVTGQTHQYRYRGRATAACGAGWSLHQWQEAQASFREYGFGRFCMELEGQCFQVDLARAFRIPDPDSRILSFLAWLDPGREILLRTDLVDPEGEWEATGCLLRMRKDVRVIPYPPADPRSLTTY